MTTKAIAISTPMMGCRMRAQTAAAEQLRQRIERRMEEGQARERQQDEADAHDPVVGPLLRVVALQVFRIADHFASSFSISSSSSLDTSFGPFIT
jgi:hypothetical protein